MSRGRRDSSIRINKNSLEERIERIAMDAETLSIEIQDFKEGFNLGGSELLAHLENQVEDENKADASTTSKINFAIKMLSSNPTWSLKKAEGYQQHFQEKSSELVALTLEVNEAKRQGEISVAKETLLRAKIEAAAEKLNGNNAHQFLDEIQKRAKMYQEFKTNVGARSPTVSRSAPMPRRRTPSDAKPKTTVSLSASISSAKLFDHPTTGEKTTVKTTEQSVTTEIKRKENPKR